MTVKVYVVSDCKNSPGKIIDIYLHEDDAEMRCDSYEAETNSEAWYSEQDLHFQYDLDKRG